MILFLETSPGVFERVDYPRKGIPPAFRRMVPVILDIQAKEADLAKVQIPIETFILGRKWARADGAWHPVYRRLEEK